MMFHQRKNLVVMSQVVFVKFKMPWSVNLEDIGVDFVGRPPGFSDGLLTGVLGRHSREALLFASSKWSQAPQQILDGCRAYLVDSKYHISNYAATKGLTTPMSVDQTGWLNLGRITSAYREELRRLWLDWIQKNSTFGTTEMLERESLLEIALQKPGFILELFKNDPGLQGVVHPVRPRFCSDVRVMAATVRFDKTRFRESEMRFFDQVAIT